MKVSAGSLILALLSAVALLGAQRGPTSPIPRGTNIIFGRITEIGTDSPIGGAIITLVGSFDASGKPASIFPTDLFSPVASAPRNVLTTSDGHFVFRDLPAGKYTIAAAAFGFERNDYPPNLVDLHDSDKPTTVPLHLWRFGAISGTVTDERGEPVVGVPISALRRQVIGGTLRLQREVSDAVTDDRGSYRLAQLRPGNYVVGAMWTPISMPASVLASMESAFTGSGALGPIGLELLRGGIRVGLPGSPIEGQRHDDVVLQQTGAPPSFSPDGRLLAYGNTLHPGTAAPSEATAITLGSGETRDGVDIPLRFSPTVRVSGVATGPDGPMKNLVVRLLPPNGADLTDSESAGVPQAVTNGSGAFRFLGVPPGAYTLKATVWMDDASAPERGLGSTLWTTQPLNVRDSDVGDIALTMKPGIRVSGRVQFKDADKTIPEIAPRIPITLRPLGAGSWRTLQALVRPDGTFATPGDPAGRYIIHAYAPPGWTVQAMLRNGKPVPDEVIELESTDITNVEFIYSKKATRLFGSIVDAAGAPDSQTDVVVFPADTTLWREGIINSRRVRSAHATSLAMFEVLALPPGDYHVVAVGAHRMANWQDPAFLERLTQGATKITLVEGDEKPLSLKTFSPGGR